MPRPTSLRPAVLFVGLAALASLQGCAVVSLGASSVVGAAVDVTSAVVVTGVKVTGKVVEKTIDAVSSDKAVPASDAPQAPTASN